jgi:hypothetical protein
MRVDLFQLSFKAFNGEFEDIVNTMSIDSPEACYFKQDEPQAKSLDNRPEGRWRNRDSNG